MSTQLARRNDGFPSLFNDFLLRPFDNWFDPAFNLRLSDTPLVNISERKNDYLVTMAAPGLKKEDFKIDVEGNMLSISSEKEEDKEKSDEKFSRREYSYSSFCRSFTLPEEVLKDKIDASYKDGVLQITMPKKEEAKKAAITKKIMVK